MFRHSTLFMITAVACFLTACHDGPQLKPNVSGKAGEVGIVLDKSNWEGELGSAFRSTLAADYPYLPQAEPMFTLFNIPNNAFNSIFQSHRNLILVNISPELSESKMVLQENVWAAPQIVVTFSGPDAASVLACFNEQKSKLVSALEQAERNRVISSSKRYEEKGLRILVNELFGGSPYFPVGYSIKKQAKNFIWISYETTYTTLGIFVYSYPYVDSTSFSKSRLLQERNAVLQREVPGQLDNSYMTTYSGPEMMPPSLHWIHYNNKDFAEIRGLWEVQNDFMGGPFVSHAYLDPQTNRVLVLEAFVYNPRYDKRNSLRQTESILYSFEWVKDQEQQK